MHPIKVLYADSQAAFTQEEQMFSTESPAENAGLSEAQEKEFEALEVEGRRRRRRRRKGGGRRRRRRRKGGGRRRKKG